MYIKFFDKEGEIDISDLTYEGLNVAKSILEEELKEIQEKIKNGKRKME